MLDELKGLSSCEENEASKEGREQARFRIVFGVSEANMTEFPTGPVVVRLA